MKASKHMAGSVLDTFECFLTCELHTSLVLIGKSELLVTICCFTKAHLMCRLWIWGRKRELGATRNKKEMPLSNYEWEKLWHIVYTTIYSTSQKEKKKKEEKRLEVPFII